MENQATSRTKTPSLKDAAARLMRAGSPRSATNRKLVAAANVLADELCRRAIDEARMAAGSPLEHKEIVSIFLGHHWNGGKWNLVKRLGVVYLEWHNDGIHSFTYGSSRAVDDLAAYHLARDVYFQGGCEAWMDRRLESFRREWLPSGQR